MPLQLNLAGVSTELEAVPPGNYEVTIAKCVEAMSKTGNPKLEVQLRIEAPDDFAGRMLFDNISLQAHVLWKLKGFLFGIGYTAEEIEVDFEFDPEEAVGLETTVAVTQYMYEDKPRNRINGYSSGAELGPDDLGVSEQDTDDFDGF